MVPGPMMTRTPADVAGAKLRRMIKTMRKNLRRGTHEAT
jgi:hypothetical protein